MNDLRNFLSNAEIIYIIGVRQEILSLEVVWPTDIKDTNNGVLKLSSPCEVHLCKMQLKHFTFGLIWALVSMILVCSVPLFVKSTSVVDLHVIPRYFCVLDLQKISLQFKRMQAQAFVQNARSCICDVGEMHL